MGDQYKELVSPQNPSGNVFGQMLVCITANLISFCQGFLTSTSSIILPQIQEVKGNISIDGNISITMDEGSWFASLYCAGFVIGSLVGGLQSDYFGRKKSIILDCFWVIIATMTISYSTSYHFLLVGRYLGGHACGSALVALTAYNSEISHKSIRGILYSMQISLFYLGNFFITMLGSLVPWRIAVGVCAAFPLITIIGLYFSPESPIWLMRFGYKKEAKKGLVFLFGSKDSANEELKAIEHSLSMLDKTENRTDSLIFKKLIMLLKEFKSPSFWKPLVLIIVLVPIISGWCGVSFITLYLVSFLSQISVPMDPYVAASILSFFRFLLGIISLFGMIRISRRVTLISTLSMMSLATITIALQQFLVLKGYVAEWGIEDYQIFHWIPIISILILYGAVAIGFAPVMRTLQGELLPASKRSLGGSIIGLLEGLMMFILNKIAPMMMENMKVYGCFSFFAGVQFGGILFVLIFLPETKGKSFNEIQECFIGGVEDQKCREGDSQNEKETSSP